MVHSFNFSFRCVGHGMRHLMVQMAVGAPPILGSCSAILPERVQVKPLAQTQMANCEILIGYIVKKTKDSLVNAQLAVASLLAAPGIPNLESDGNYGMPSALCVWLWKSSLFYWARRSFSLRCYSDFGPSTKWHYLLVSVCKDPCAFLLLEYVRYENLISFKYLRHDQHCSGILYLAEFIRVLSFKHEP